MLDLTKDKELMKDFNACIKFRRIGNYGDLVQFARARKYSIGFIERMQNFGLYSLWIWCPILVLYPTYINFLWAVIYFLIFLLWDEWWAQGFVGHQNFDHFSVEDLKEHYGDRWEDGPERI